MKTKQPTPDIFTTDTLERFPLLYAFVRIWQQCRPAFEQDRIHLLGLQTALGLLTAFGRRTISRGICARAQQHFDWSKYYRFFSKDIWSPIVLTHQLLSHLSGYLGADSPLVIGLDDTSTDKTGRKIPASGYFYNPKSPPFARSFKWAIRFISISALVPHTLLESATGILLKLKLAPVIPKPKKNASDKAHKQYRQMTRHWSIATQALEQIQLIRAQMDAIDTLGRRLLVVVADATYTTQAMLRGVPRRCVYIGRTRRDIKIFKPADKSQAKGAKKKYGKQMPTPEKIRRDKRYKWRECRIFACGKWHTLRYKSVAPVLWKNAGYKYPCRIIVIEPLAYRLTKRSRLLYRDPAYLLVSDPGYNVGAAIQHYFHRWEIEVNHRDAKDSFGVGDAQVRNPRSVARQFGFAALMYSLLRCASLDSYGRARTGNYAPLPKWRNDPRSRPSSLDMVSQLRMELWTHEAGEQAFEHFGLSDIAPNTPEYTQQALAWLAENVPKGLSVTAWSAILHANA